MFERLYLRGTAGAILFGYKDAAVLRGWTVYHHRPDAKHDDRWTLVATFARVDKYLLRQRPLVFSAKRDGLQGLWCFPLHDSSVQIGDTQLTATLGPPER